MQHSKVKAVKDWLIPQNVKELQSFLGFCNYYRKLIHQYSKIAYPMLQLARKKIEFEWSEEVNAAFEKLKQKMCEEPILKYVDMNKPFTIHTDGSTVAVGAILFQKHNGRLHPVAYESRRLTDREINLNAPSYMREFFALARAVTLWRHYLRGRKFTAFSDNLSLTKIQSQKDLSRQHIRWVEMLQEYDFELKHIDGKKNQSDALSRREHDINEIMTPDLSEFKKRIIKNYKRDEDFGEVYDILKHDKKKSPKMHQKAKRFKIIEDLLFEEPDRLCAPRDQKLRVEILHDLHDSKCAGHRGFDQTFASLHDKYSWPNMANQLAKHIKNCDKCQRNKPRNQSKLGYLSPMPIPARNWDEISMDFITSLPKTDKGFDAILVVVDKLSKMAHFIPTTAKAKASTTADLFLSNIYKLHGLPLRIISDRDPRLTSNFWKMLMDKLEIKMNMSTSRHPQTDGQTERMNRVLEEVSRNYVAKCPRSWEVELYFAEFSINNSKNSAIKKTPLELNGQTPRTPHDLIFHTKAPAVNNLLSHLDTQRKIAIDNMKKALDNQAAQVNQHRREEEFEVGREVLLSKSALEESKVKKLDALYYGPCKISKKISKVAYKLELPESMQIHPAFHISNLKKYNNEQLEFQEKAAEKTTPRLPAKTKKIEKILASRKRAEKLLTEYLGQDKDEARENAKWISENAVKSDYENGSEAIGKFWKKPRLKLKRNKEGFALFMEG